MVEKCGCFGGDDRVERVGAGDSRAGEEGLAVSSVLDVNVDVSCWVGD